MTKSLFTMVTLLTSLSRVALAQPPPPPTIEYYHLDAVGSVRAVTNETGQVVRQHHYFPFGEEYLAQGGNDPRRFTGKERDAETGLDYFGARYYAQRSGRFATVDPVQTTADDLTDPQRWNRYAYVRNNPLRFTDPDGRCIYPGADCLQYLAGVAKAVVNALPDTASLLNKGVNVLLAPLTDFRFGDAPRFEPANEDQRRGVFAADIAMLLSALVELGAAKTAVAANAGLINAADLVPTHGLTLSRRELSRLKTDILENGIKETIKYVEVNGHKYVVDGHHRLRVAQTLGIQHVPAERVQLPFRGYQTVDDLFGWR